jgi:RND family efflux transporter MFP subunit
VSDRSTQSRWSHPQLRRVANWLTAVSIVGLALVLLGPGLAKLSAGDKAAGLVSAHRRPPPPRASAGAREAGAPTRLAAVTPVGESEQEDWGAPADGSLPFSDPELTEDLATSLDCIMEPSQVIDVRSAVRGRIEKIHVERGESVEAGRVLVELDSSVEQATVDLASRRKRMTIELDTRSARLELGERRRQRAEDLHQGNALSVDRREEAETEARVAGLELQQARENRELAALELRRAVALLERRTIRSPISGYVVDQVMSRGEVVDEETILRLAQTDPLRVEVILPSDFYGSIRPGMRGEVTPEVPDAGVHVASVAIVDRMVDPASSTFGVRLDLPNPDHSIPGGLRCQVRFLAE